MRELHVAVGVIRDARGNILVARRHAHLHQGGLWEFPGGKVAPGETVEQALRRELHEELEIVVASASPLMKLRHDYGDRQVCLDVWRVDDFRGEARGRENQPIRWARPEELLTLDFPAANRPIVAAARLPERYPIVDEESGDFERVRERLERLHRSGHRMAQLRAKDLDAGRYRELAARATDYCRARGLDLLLNADPETALAVGAAGAHLTSRRLMSLESRLLPKDLWVAASCHGAAELRQAERIGVDFAVLSPVLTTPTHPDAQPLGWPRFGALVEEARLPVYALGGMTPAHLAEAQRRGAQGVAGIRGFGGE
jgi:8-oxo-dGTP diphosphatase